MENTQKIMILDFGGQHSQLLARRVREMGVYCEVLTYAKPVPIDSWRDASVKGVILTGGPSGYDEDGLTQLSSELRALGVPALDVSCGALAPLEVDDREILRNFVFDACGCTAGYRLEDQIEHMIKDVREQVGDAKVVAALSGGVDSSVASVIADRALKKGQLTCVFVDHGLLRQNEAAQVMQTYHGNLGLDIIHVDASDRFLAALRGVTDPEQKRKIIGETFVRVFEEHALRINAKFLLQGTIYPDIIESGIDGFKSVKSHHNVGGMPKESMFQRAQLVEPLKYLFKDEVRRVGEALGIPHDMLWRQPFPGPGLAVRCIGELTRDRLDLLRQCDWIYREEIEKAGLNESIWQYFAVLTGVRTVGVTNDERTYADCVALRAVVTEDAMAAEIAQIPYALLNKIVRRIIGEVPSVNRVVYDITAKPPGTIEWE